MKGLRKCISAVTAAALVLTALPIQGTGITANAAVDVADTADTTVKVLTENASTFHDMDNDGLGEFEGWGTSLCWWANRLGYDESLTQQAADKFYGDDGLDLNIGRYNVGGGDNVGEVEPVQANPKAQVYDLETDGKKPTYSGKNMKVETKTDFRNVKYTVSDADFGITEGTVIGDMKMIGWIKNLEGTVGDGDNLNYTVNVPTADAYTVKLMMMHNNNTGRDVAVRVGGAGGKTYVANNEQVQNSKVMSASGSNNCLFLITLDNIELAEGDNIIEIAGKNDWTLDFVKMLVVKSDEKGILPEKSDFLHAPHIKRSDSAVPGYCTNVTKLPSDYTDAQKQAYEQEHGFARVDWECGYAWDYDWDADANQMNILKAAQEASGEDFIAEAFSNSPPYFMTVSGCSSGNADSSKDNLRKDSYHAFAVYMADVIAYWAGAGVVNFTSATPMNEPYTNYWGANSAKQEGCHFDQGASESNIIVEFKKALEQKKADVTSDNAKAVIDNMIFSGTDETSIDTAIESYNKLSAAAKKIITRIDTHTYGGSKREELCKLAEKEGKNLWMSEIDGASLAGTNAGEMAPALGFAQRIITDLNGLKASAWIMWNAVDMNVDTENEFDANTIEELKTKKNDDGTIMYDPANKGYWGIAIGDHNNKKLVLTKKYYAYGQFSRYIRPGYTIMGTSDTANTLVAYDTKGKNVVIVAVNTAGTDKTWKFDLSRFASIGSEIKAYRSSGVLDGGENWADVSSSADITADTADRSFTAAMKANSITTFVVKNVEFNKEAADKTAEQEKLLAGMRQEIIENIELGELNLSELEISVTGSMLSGSAPYNNSDTDTVDKVIDGKYDTFFDGLTNGYVQIDLGEGKAQAISAFGYAPRSGYEGRCQGAELYGSNDGKKWTLIHTITETPEKGKLTYVYINQFKVESFNQPYRYYKYTNAKAESNIAEIKLYGVPEDLELPEIPDTLAKWVSYCEQNTAGHKYSTETTAAYNTALAAAKAAGASDDTMYDLFKAYLALKEIYDYKTFTGTNGDAMYDNNGEVIQAHGGQVQEITVKDDKDAYDFNGNGTIETEEKTFWYWIGEDKTNDYRPCPGIHAYISKDLLNWVDKGCVLRTVDNWNTFTTDEYFTNLYGDLTEAEKFNAYKDIWTADGSTSKGCVIERPKMLTNGDKYVIWFHAGGQVPASTSDDGTGTGTDDYGKAKAGIAVSDSPFGPFKMKGSYLLACDPDIESRGDKGPHGFDSEGGHVRDMNLFKDDDGQGYVMYSSEGNEVMYIAKLNADYTFLAKDADKMVLGEDFCISSTDSREAPAMFKYNNKYYLITSGCTGWYPNQAAYAVADSPLGPWKRMGDPCIDDTNGNTFQTQSTCVIPVDAAAGKFIYMGDRWHNPDTGNHLRNSRYVWLPIEFGLNDTIAIKKYADWSMAELDDKGAIEFTSLRNFL